MEPIDAWLEEELRRNDMHPKPIKVQVGAAEVAFQPPEYPTNIDPTWHPEEDAFQLPLFKDSGELYSVPPKLSQKDLNDLVPLLGNVMESVEQLPADMVVLPEHYARFKIEPIRFVIENNLNFFQANIVKYIMRYDAKNGMEDLKKAQRYLTMFIKWVEGNPDWWRKGE
jgi:hypothetical protein